MNYLKLVFFVLWIIIYSPRVFSWSYPLKNISKPSCKYEYWNDLDNNCKEKLPIIHNAKYESYKNNINYRRIYSVLWMSSYKWGWDIWKWSHLGVDIATAQWTPVYSIGAGKVVWGWRMNGWGKTVVIQHKLDNWKYIYSNYTHLNKVIVKAQTTIKESQQIGTVGHSGNSTGNHLHFQIDTNQAISRHPWYHSSSCSAGLSIFDIVNGTSCQKNALANTIDPIDFLESNGAIISKSFDKMVIDNSKAIVNKQINRKEIISIEEIRKDEIKSFIKKYNFSIKVYPVWWSVEIGRYGKIILSITKKSSWKPFDGILPGDVIIDYNTNYISSLYPRKIKIIKWHREISFLTRKTWVTPINIKFGKISLFKNIYIRIINKWKSIIPNNSYIQLLWGKQYTNTDRLGVVIMRDSNMNKIININYKWRYKLYSNNPNIKFCKIKISSIKDKIRLSRHLCKVEGLSNDLIFSYNDTFKWIYIFKVIWNKEWIFNVSVKKDNKIIWESMLYRIKNIKDYTKSIYSHIINKAGWYWIMLGLIKNGYLSPNKELNLYEANLIIKNFVNNIEQKLWKTFPSRIKLSSKDKYKKITRWSFIKLIFQNIWYKVKDYSKIDYLDLKNKINLKDIANIAQFLKLRGFQWKDRFWDKYFQPNKNIQKDEAIYLIYKMERMLVK